ncbi:hypothetical protein Pan216_02900 [Planctomycetes bacterium Pan216]|uniref:Uncharacterized protein n=1 Tax=Kolteria novifilia TaxID=2527975 RepID=A0A518AXK6_9BACT|nr:hypothetical protein Pan216_02900 [Planctomycetes bacterium Pan216]
MNPYASFSDDFYLYCYLNTELELPRSRDTVLHYFGQIGKAFPTMTNFYGQDANEYVLEEDRELGSYRWISLEPRRACSGYMNPPSPDSCHAQHELMLELAPHLLSVTPLDCEAVDVMFGFDFSFKGNHDEIVGEVFASEGRLGSLVGMPEGKLINFEPTLTIALDEECRLQCRLSVVTRTNSYQVRTNQFNEDAISVYFTVRQYWNQAMSLSFVESYRQQFETGVQLVDSYVIPNVVVPLSEAISAR